MSWYAHAGKEGGRKAGRHRDKEGDASGEARKEAFQRLRAPGYQSTIKAVVALQQPTASKYGIRRSMARRGADQRRTAQSLDT
jgi:hypothetical protein